MNIGFYLGYSIPDNPMAYCKNVDTTLNTMGKTRGVLRRMLVGGNNYQGTTDLPGTRALLANCASGCVYLYPASRGCRQREYYPGGTYANGEYLIRGYANKQEPVYYSGIDPTKYGTAWGLLRRCLVSASYDSGSHCGSRCIETYEFGSRYLPSTSARGCNERVLSWEG